MLFFTFSLFIIMNMVNMIIIPSLSSSFSNQTFISLQLTQLLTQHTDRGNQNSFWNFSTSHTNLPFQTNYQRFMMCNNHWNMQMKVPTKDKEWLKQLNKTLNEANPANALLVNIFLGWNKTPLFGQWNTLAKSWAFKQLTFIQSDTFKGISK